MKDPLTHVYLFYDLIYEMNNTEIYLALSNDDIVGYLLIWRGYKILGIHIWGQSFNLIKYIPHVGKFIIHVYNDALVIPTFNYLKSRNAKADVKMYLDMVTNEDLFIPYSPERARRLSIEDLDKFIELKRVQGRFIDRSFAKKVITKGRYYGVFHENKLVSIACSYLKTNDVWIIGDVYTHPDYRGRGYAKIVTSAITKDAVSSGAKALLHVEESNKIAINVYKKLGYKTIGKKKWIFVNN